MNTEDLRPTSEAVKSSAAAVGCNRDLMVTLTIAQFYALVRRAVAEELTELQASPPPEGMTDEEVRAELVRCSQPSLRIAIREGLPHSRLWPGAPRRYLRADVIAWMRSRQVVSRPESTGAAEREEVFGP